MKKLYSTALLMFALIAAVKAQFNFPVEITTDWNGTLVNMPPNPLKYQVLFVGGTDIVQTVDASGNPNGYTLAKEWHDFIGFTPATSAEVSAFQALGHHNFLGWISVNHEMIWNDNKIGDGGGMTVFAVKRGDDGTLIPVPQTLPDGRTGVYFNVDFVNTVGETGMNCGGISSVVDGRIWTAEEWFRTNNVSINTGNNSPFVGNAANTGVRDTADFTLDADEFTGTNYDGQTIKKYENFNWMVEIDPRTAKAIRKQYNWGRAGWEGGAIAKDNKTVYLGEDDTPGRFVKFVADVAGDFTKGKVYVYKHDAATKWVEINNASLSNMLNFKTQALSAGQSCFARLEWVAVDTVTGKVYMTETGNDNLNLSSAVTAGGVIPPHFALAYKQRYKTLTGLDFPYSDAAALDSVRTGKFKDYYGRVLVYDPATMEVTTLIEGGPYYATSPAIASYPTKHLSNPDGLGMFYLDGKRYLAIMEDLNGRTFGRVPSENSASGGEVCELYLLDLSIANPTINDLIKISATPKGAEITGFCATPDGKSILANSQHPLATHPGDYKHSLTYAISGWDNAVTSILNPTFGGLPGFEIWPNPASRELNFKEAMDVAIYDSKGQRVKVVRNSQTVDISDLEPGMYYIMNDKAQTQKLLVE